MPILEYLIILCEQNHDYVFNELKSEIVIILRFNLDSQVKLVKFLLRLKSQTDKFILKKIKFSVINIRKSMKEKWR